MILNFTAWNAVERVDLMRTLKPGAMDWGSGD